MSNEVNVCQMGYGMSKGIGGMSNVIVVISNGIRVISNRIGVCPME